MDDHTRPDIEMRLDGSFVDPPQVPWSARLLRYAAIAAILSVALFGALLLLGLALFMIPVAIGSVLLAWAAFRYRLWKMGRSGGGRDIFSP